MNPARLVVAVSLVLGVVAAPLAALAQPPAGKSARLGFLSPGSAAPAGAVGTAGLQGPSLTAFRQGLRDRGWIEGRNLVIEYRWAEGNYSRLPELAAELVRLKVDLIFANAGSAALAAKRATATIPIVFETLGDPVSAGLVGSLARPGGNLTGLSGLAPELSGKRLELPKEVVPDLRQVVVLVNPSNVMTPPTLRETEQAATSLGLRLQVVEVGEPAGLEAAFATFARARSDALIILQDAMFSNQASRIVASLTRARLPAVFGGTGWVKAGGLMSYAPSLPDMFFRAAGYVDRILRGAKPADLPVEQPTRFELVINLKTAKALSLTIPPPLLLRADQVIQ